MKIGSPTFGAAARLTAMLALFGLVGAAQAQDRRFVGTWRIEGAALAPWADPSAPLDPTEPKRLIGKTVTFGRNSIVGPEPLGCLKPVYAVRQDGPDMIFQGALAEPDQAGKPRDAAALARALGMTSATVVTLETGCSEIEYHALAPDSLVFGLNDQVYTIRRAPAAGKGGDK